MGASVIVITASAAMIVTMAAAWVVARVTDNGGWIDVFWSFGTGALGAALALAPVSGTPGLSYRQVALAVLVAIWGLRLGGYIVSRVVEGHEDARYAALRQSWGARYATRLLGFALAQAVAAILLALAIRLAARNTEPGIRVLDIVGLTVLAVAIVGEGVADRQLARFKADPANRGRVCDVGLWGWSRHPNYFFEWLGWIAYPLLAIEPNGDGLGWLAWLGPVFMFLLLRYLSGVPPLERHMMRSRPEAYGAYRNRTSAFVPLPPRR